MLFATEAALMFVFLLFFNCLTVCTVSIREMVCYEKVFVSFMDFNRFSSSFLVTKEYGTEMNR